MVPRSNLHNHALLILLLMYHSPRTHSAISVDVETEYYHQALIDLLTHREQECNLKFDRFWLCVWYDLDIGASEYQWEIGLSWKDVLLIVLVRSFFKKDFSFLWRWKIKQKGNIKSKFVKLFWIILRSSTQRNWEISGPVSGLFFWGNGGREERGSVSFLSAS